MPGIIILLVTTPHRFLSNKYYHHCASNKILLDRTADQDEALRRMQPRAAKREI